MPERHYWDTCCWIDFFEEGGDPAKPMTKLWVAISTGRVELLFSPVVMAETLFKAPGDVYPVQDPKPADAIFDTSGLILVQIDRPIGVRARTLRRAYGLKTPDALHVACALEQNVDVLITRDASDLLKLPVLERRDGEKLQIINPAAAADGPLFGGPT